ncbi:hypothetical protein ES708_30310 [subsurface metagenome]
MNIPKAIEGSQEAVTFLSIHHQPRLAKAAQLGREALKEVERLRSHKPFNVQKILPGETEE